MNLLRFVLKITPGKHVQKFWAERTKNRFDNSTQDTIKEKVMCFEEINAEIFKSRKIFCINRIKRYLLYFHCERSERG